MDQRANKHATLQLVSFLAKLNAISDSTYFPFIREAMDTHVKESTRKLMRELEKSIYGQDDN